MGGDRAPAAMKMAAVGDGVRTRCRRRWPQRIFNDLRCIFESVSGGREKEGKRGRKGKGVREKGSGKRGQPELCDFSRGKGGKRGQPELCDFSRDPRLSRGTTRYMPRRERCIVPGVPCHVTQRGVDRRETFSAD